MDEQKLLYVIGIIAVIVGFVIVLREGYLTITKRGYVSTKSGPALTERHRFYRESTPKTFWTLFGISALLWAWIGVIGLVAIYFMARNLIG